MAEVEARVVSPEIFNIAPAKLPVEVILLTVVDARVELPVTLRFAKFPVFTVKIFAARLPVIVKFDAVVLPIVDEPVVSKFVIFAVSIFEVEAFVVEE